MENGMHAQKITHGCPTGVLQYIIGHGIHRQKIFSDKAAKKRRMKEGKSFPMLKGSRYVLIDQAAGNRIYGVGYGAGMGRAEIK